MAYLLQRCCATVVSNTADSTGFVPVAFQLNWLNCCLVLRHPAEIEVQIAVR